MKKVLLIDDDSAIHLIASAALQNDGAFELAFARNGRQGLERAKATMPDLILLDHMMPDIDGDEVLAELRRDFRFLKTPVLFLTAKGEQGVDYVALGAQGLIAKPFEPDKLAAQIRRALHLTDEPAPAPASGDHNQTPFPSGGSVEQLRHSFVGRGLKEIAHLLTTVGPKFDIDAARRLTHLWIGRGGTLGYPRISVVARRLELRLAEDWNADNKWRLESDLTEVQQAFEDAWAKERESGRAPSPAAQRPPPVVYPEPGLEVAPGDGPLAPAVEGAPQASARVEAETAADGTRLENEAAAAQTGRQVVGPESEVQSATTPGESDPSAEVLEVLDGRVIGVCGFDEDATEAIKNVFRPVRAIIKAGATSIEGAVEGPAADAVVVNADGTDPARAWGMVDELSGRGVPVLVIGRGRELVGFARRSQACEFMLAPWSGEEVVFRCYRLLSRGSSPLAHGPTTPQAAVDGGVSEVAVLADDADNNKIVIADDDPTITALVRMTLLKAGLVCHEAGAGEDALELVRTVRPLAVVLDVNMPQMDGFEVLAALRNDPETHAIPVLMLTAMRQDADVIRGFRLGADDYVVKPFNPIELSARLERLVRKRD